MTFGQYWVILLKHWKLIIACFLIAGVGTYIGSRFITPLYQSTALVQVVIQSANSQANYDSVMASDQLVQTEAQLVTSDPILSEVASHYGMTITQLAGEVSATTRVNTQLLEIDVVDASPQRAADLANSVAVTLIKQQIQSAQQHYLQSQQQLEQDIQQTEQQVTTITHQIAALQANKGDDAQIQALQIKLNGLQQHYNQAQTVLVQIEQAQAQNGSFLELAQSAQPSSNPVRPNKLINTAAGLVIGLLTGMVLAVMLEQLDTRVRSSESLSQLLNLSVLTTVWQLEAKGEESISLTGSSINDESYRILRTNIGFTAVGQPLHTFVVTSATAGEGKSTIAANLALFMARAGKNTLLIDANMHSPSQHQFFGLSNNNGLSNAILALSTSFLARTSQFRTSTTQAPGRSLAGGAHFSLHPFVYSVNIPNLCIMPAGPLPPNPAELLDSKAFGQFLATLNTCGAEIVIFDAPPLLSLSDASILSSKVDGTLLVVDIGKATKTSLKQARALLGQVGAHVLGCVTNKQRRTRNDTIYSYSSSEEQSENENFAHNGNASASPSAPVNIFKPPVFHAGSLVERKN